MDSSSTILVFGDNSAVLELIERTLSLRGYRVLTTTDPGEALEVGRRVRVDLLVADVVPGMRALARELVSIQTRLRVLSMFDADHPEPRNGYPATFIRKPVALADLEAAVSAALADGD